MQYSVRDNSQPSPLSHCWHCDPALFHSPDVHTEHYTLHTTHCTLHTVHYTLHMAYSTLYTKHCTLQGEHCTFNTTKCNTALLSTLQTSHCSRYCKLKIHTAHHRPKSSDTALSSLRSFGCHSLQVCCNEMTKLRVLTAWTVRRLSNKLN